MTVGIVGRESLADLVAAALGHHDIAVGGADDVTAERPDWIVAEGLGELRNLVRSGVDAPVLVVEPGSGRENGAGDGGDEFDEWPGQAIPTVPRAEIGAAVERTDADDLPEVTRTPLAVAVDGAEVGRALFDVALVPDEPATICEYSVGTARERVASVRADGVVVATPAGSYGYASAAGGPILETGTGVVAVVPVAAFVTDADDWVLDADGARLDVEREETVAVVADGYLVEYVGADEGVEFATAEDVQLYDWPG